MNVPSHTDGVHFRRDCSCAMPLSTCHDTQHLVRKPHGKEPLGRPSHTQEEDRGDENGLSSRRWQRKLGIHNDRDHLEEEKTVKCSVKTLYQENTENAGMQGHHRKFTRSAGFCLPHT
jgi:hypothetical protein